MAFAEILEETLAKGALVELIADRDTELHSRYWFPRSEVIVSVQGPSHDAPGSIWSAGRARDAANWKRPHPDSGADHFVLAPQASAFWSQKFEGQ
ncbi:hypothetical protein [Myceligenerans cantabricum]